MNQTAGQNAAPDLWERALPEGSDPCLRRDAAENRVRILTAARRLFEAQGVESTSMRQIAHASDVGQGTLYRRYAHKGEVCQDLIAQSAQHFFAEVETYLEETRLDTPSLDRVAQFLARLTAFIEAHLPYLNAMGDACSGKRRADWFQSPWYAWLHATLSGLLSESAGEAAEAPRDAAFTADALLAVLGPDVYQLQREVRGLSREEILSKVHHIYTPCGLS